MQARHTNLLINYEGTDISQDIAPYLLGFTFTDNSGGKADDLTLTLEDRAGTWLYDWQPSKSDIITASIVKHDAPNTTMLPCGSFTIDQIDYSFPPATLAIKAVSSSITKQASSQRHTRAWENVTLGEICSELASANGLKLFMTTQGNNRIERIEQVMTSDLEFLRKLCADFGQAVKIQEGQVVIYDIEEFEAREAVQELDASDAKILSCRFTSKAAGTYRKARLKYHDPVKDEDIEAEYSDEVEEGSERELEIRERVESQGDAERIVRERLASANRGEITGSITLIGDTRYAAGVNIELKSFGQFDGKHFVNKCTHKIDGSGYTVTLELGQSQGEKPKRTATRRKSTKQKISKSGPGEVFWEG